MRQWTKASTLSNGTPKWLWALPFINVSHWKSGSWLKPFKCWTAEASQTRTCWARMWTHWWRQRTSRPQISTLWKAVYLISRSSTRAPWSWTPTSSIPLPECISSIWRQAPIYRNRGSSSPPSLSTRMLVPSPEAKRENSATPLWTSSCPSPQIAQIWGTVVVRGRRGIMKSTLTRRPHCFSNPTWSCYLRS